MGTNEGCTAHPLVLPPKMPCYSADLLARFQTLLAEGEPASRRFHQLFTDCHIALEAERTQRQREAQKAAICIEHERAKVDRKEKEFEPLRTLKREIDQQPVGNLISPAVPPTAIVLSDASGGKKASSHQLADENELCQLARQNNELGAELRELKIKFREKNKELGVARAAIGIAQRRIKELEAQFARVPPALDSMAGGADANIAMELGGFVQDMNDARDADPTTDEEDFQSDHDDEEEYEEEYDEEEDDEELNDLVPDHNNIPLLLDQCYSEKGPKETHAEHWYLTFKNNTGALSNAIEKNGENSPYRMVAVSADKNNVYFDFDCGRVVDSDIQARLITTTNCLTFGKLTQKKFEDKAVILAPSKRNKAGAFKRSIHDVVRVVRVPVA